MHSSSDEAEGGCAAYCQRAGGRSLTVDDMGIGLRPGGPAKREMMGITQSVADRLRAMRRRGCVCVYAKSCGTVSHPQRK